jgi:hypothetical protein
MVQKLSFAQGLSFIVRLGSLMARARARKRLHQTPHFGPLPVRLYASRKREAGIAFARTVVVTGKSRASCSGGTLVIYAQMTYVPCGGGGVIQ